VRERNEEKIKIYSLLAPRGKTEKKRKQEASANHSVRENVKGRRIKWRRTGTTGTRQASVVRPRGADIGKLLAGVVIPAGVAAVNIAPYAILPVEAIRLRRTGKRPVARRKAANIAERAGHVRREGESGEE